MGKPTQTYLYRHLLILAFIAIGSIFDSYSQCPTVTNPTQSFCDINAPVIANLSATNNGNGIRWYATAISTTPLANGLGLINGEDYYADDNSGTCGIRQRVDVTIYGPPTGLSFQGVCVDDPNEATIADLIATGNNIQWYTTASGGTPLAPSTVLMDNTIYYVNQSNPDTGCRTSRLSVFVNVGVVPVPIGEAIQEFCSDLQPPPTVADLQASGNNNWYLTISSASPLDSDTPLVDGQSYFATTVDPPCESIERLEVMVVFTAPIDPGANGTINLCETDLGTTTSVNLFDALGGTPDTNGTWSGPLPTSNGNLGTVDVTTLTVAGSPYVFSYAVTSDSCGTSTSTVTITIISPPDAGTNGTLDLCEIDAPVNLFNSLGGTPDTGGSWSPALASGTGIFDPAVDASGTYTYEVTGTAPCANAFANVLVNVSPVPEPGTNGSINLCETDLGTTITVNLFDALNGSPDANGTWSGPLPTSNGNLGTVNVTTLTVEGSPYIFTYSVNSSSCGTSTSTVTITIVPPPDAGANGMLDLCENDAPVDLFDSLGGTPDAGGTWSPALASGTGIFDPAVDAAGTYTYEVTGTGPCANAIANVLVTVSPIPEPGTNGFINLCETDLGTTITVNLFDALGGSPDTNGTWSGPLPTSNGNLGTVNVTTLTVEGSPYIFTYSVNSSSCGTSTSTVTITIVPPPNAGTNGMLDICENSAPVDLFDSLGGAPDAGGSWSPALASGTGIFDPAVDAAGTYTYEVTGTAPCANAIANVFVTINPVPEPGTNGSINLCETDLGTTVNLFDALGGTPDTNGTWSGPLPTSNGNLGTVDVTTLTVVGSPYVFVYSITSTSCGTSTSTVTITIVPPPNAGTNGMLDICENSAPVDLFDSLGGTPETGGSWSPALASGTGIFNPAVDAAGTYTYEVTGTEPCANAIANVLVTVSPIPEPGTNGFIDLCETDLGTTISVNLFDALGGSPDAIGTWSGPLPTSNGNLGTVDVTTLTVAGSPYVFTYSVTSTSCGTSTSTVTITIVPPPDAGTNGILDICENDAPVDLFASLGGTPDAGGSWSPALASGTGIFDPAVDAPGTYTYEVTAPASCGTASTAVLVTVTEAPNATGLTLTVDSVCLGLPSLVSISGATQLTDGQYSVTYTLSGANTSQTTIIIVVTNGSAEFTIPDLLLSNPGITTFTLTGFTNTITACGANVGGISTVQFNIIQDPTPELITDGNSFCLEDDPTIADLTSNLIGTNAVIWYDALENGTPYLDSTLLVDGTTYYASNDIEDGCDNGIRLAVTVSIQTCEVLVLIIPDGFSPNDDGINDDFLIKNLRELYPDFKLQVYNRYGNILYEGDINTPNWNGTSDKGREFGSSILPVGVYFFVLELNDSTNKTIQGRVYLSR